MAYNFVDTPRTEAGDRTHLTAANLSFSEIQSYPSPSKDGSNDLVSRMRSRNNGQALRTPRARNALSGLSNTRTRNEFTPLLKSAAANRMKSFPEDTENTVDDLVSSVMAAGPGGVPRTPAYLKPGYKEAQTPGLPIDSSVLNGEDTRSSGGAGATPVPPNVASSSLMSTPMPILPPRGEEGRGDQGNVLTLREQEAVSGYPSLHNAIRLTCVVAIGCTGQGEFQSQAQNSLSRRSAEEKWHGISARHDTTECRAQD